MKTSIELKALALGALTSFLAVALAFGAGVVLKKANAPTRPKSMAAIEAVVSSDHPEEDISKSAAMGRGRTLFMKNCAHCHGEDARGDEGPNLHGLKRSNEWITRRIRNGVKGEMTAFDEKFSAQDIEALIVFLRSLR